MMSSKRNSKLNRGNVVPALTLNDAQVISSAPKSANGIRV
jgi:hypothetical protein